MDRRLFFISHSSSLGPGASGGDLVVYRHLRELEREGYKIIVVSTHDGTPARHHFEQVVIKKKTGYPPLRRRFQLLVRWHCRLLARDLVKKCRLGKDDLVISLFGEYTCLVAAYAASFTGAAHFLIFHDDHVFNDYGQGNLVSPGTCRKVAALARTVFVVSEEMKDLLELEVPECHAVLLYPMPGDEKFEETREWRAASEKELRLIYGGTVFITVHDQVLRKLSGALAIVKGTLDIFSTRSYEATALRDRYPWIVPHPALGSARELKEQAHENYDLAVVFYSFDRLAEPRMESSFPSKFCELVHAGIPVYLLAPPQSTLGSWAVKNNWLAYTSSDNPAEIAGMLARFRDRSFWEDCRGQTAAIARTQFDPHRIHSLFSDELAKK